MKKGEKDENHKTVILHEHTVGVNDYGDLKEMAFDPDSLMERLREIELPEEVKHCVCSV